jgi:hypothetical protein
MAVMWYQKDRKLVKAARDQERFILGRIIKQYRPSRSGTMKPGHCY